MVAFPLVVLLGFEPRTSGGADRSPLLRRSTWLSYRIMCVLLLGCTSITTYTVNKITLYCKYIYYTRVRVSCV